MGKKPQSRGKRPISQNLNPTAPPFVPAASGTVKSSTATLNPTAAPFIPTSSDIAKSPDKSADSHAETPTKSPSLEPVSKDVTTATLKVPSKRTTISDASSPDKTESDGHLTDGGSSVASGDARGLRRNMSKSQKRKLHRKPHSSGGGDALKCEDAGGHERPTDSSSGDSGDKTLPATSSFASPSPKERDIHGPVKLNLEEPTTFTITVPSAIKYSRADDHSGKEDSALAAQVMDLQRQLKQRETQIVTAESKVNDRDKRLTEFQTKYSDASSKVASLETQLVAMENKVKKCEFDLASSKAQEAKFAADNANFLKTQTDMEHQLANAQESQKKFTDLTKQLKATTQEASELREKLEKMHSKHEAEIGIRNQQVNLVDSRDLEDMREDLRKKDMAVQKSEMRFEEVRAKNTKLEVQLDGIRIQVNRISELERYNQELERQLNEAADKISRADKARKESEEEVKSQNTEYLNLLTSFRQKEEALKAMESKMINRVSLGDSTAGPEQMPANLSPSAGIENRDSGQASPTDSAQNIDLSRTVNIDRARETSPLSNAPSSGGIRSSSYVWGGKSMSVSPQTKHADTRGSQEGRYVSTVAHIVVVNAAPDTIIQHNHIGPASETKANGELDTFGMAKFKPGVNERGDSESRSNHPSESESADTDPANTAFLIEPGTEVSASSIQPPKDANGISEGDKVAHGPSIAEPVRRKYDGSNTLSHSVAVVVPSSESAHPATHKADQVLPLSQEAFDDGICTKTSAVDKVSDRFKLYSFSTLAFGVGFMVAFTVTKFTSRW